MLQSEGSVTNYVTFENLKKCLKNICETVSLLECWPTTADRAVAALNQVHEKSIAYVEQ